MTTPNDPGASDRDQLADSPLPGADFTFPDERDDRDDRSGAGRKDPPPGIREGIGATIEAVKRLVRSHIDLAKAEAGDILDEVGRVAALGGFALALLLIAGFLIPVGLFLWLGDWLFGSIGWGALLGGLFLIDIAVAVIVTALGVSGGRIGRAFVIAAVIGIAVGVVLGLDLTNRGWTLAAEQVLPQVDAGWRPLALAAGALAIVGAVLGQIMGFRSGGAGPAIKGLFGGAILGALIGALTAIALGPQVGAAIGTLAWLLAWPALVGLDVGRVGIDTEELKKRFYPDATIETTKETIEWVRERTPLGRRS